MPMSPEELKRRQAETIQQHLQDPKERFPDYWRKMWLKFRAGEKQQELKINVH